jgi:hypothetical protein
MNRAALVFGPAFLILGGVYLLEDLGVLDVRLAVVLPLLVIMAGIVLLASSAARADR